CRWSSRPGPGAGGSATSATRPAISGAMSRSSSPRRCWRSPGPSSCRIRAQITFSTGSSPKETAPGSNSSIAAWAKSPPSTGKESWKAGATGSGEFNRERSEGNKGGWEIGDPERRVPLLHTTKGTTMSIAQTMLDEFEQEAKTTRRFLERLPDDKLD